MNIEWWHQMEAARKRRVAVAAGLAALVVLGLTARAISRSGADRANLPVFEVQQGPLTISVAESGSIQSREKVVLKAEVEGRTTILWLIEEGAQVKQGDLLVELDASVLEDGKLDQQIRSQNAEAAFIRAREQLEIIKNQAEADIAQAELDFRFAHLALEKYEEGEYPQELQQAEAEITLAREELQRATDKQSWSDRLAEEGYITRMELQADELAAKRAEIELELANGKLNLLRDYTYLQKKEELESEVEQKRLALDRVRRRTAADIVQAEADLWAKESEFERQKSRLEKILEQIAKCRIVAPADGMVVYATTGQGGWRGSTEPLAEGQEVRERQDLIYLPTAAAMMAEIRIHESSLRKVTAGLPARVYVDAMPDRSFRGRVARIALLPDAQHGWLNPDLKVYNTEIHLDGVVEDLRPGMNCRAEIIIEEHDDVLFVPVQSVVRVAGRPTVFVQGRRGPEPREVRLGLDNNRMTHVLSGLSPGERVLLTPPLDSAERPQRGNNARDGGNRAERTR